MVLFLQTTHLDLVATTLLHVDAEIAGREQLAELLGVAVPRDWPPAGVDRDTLRHFRARLAAEGQASVGWYGWYAIARRTALQAPSLVGGACFFGPPDGQGAVELAFAVLPAYRGRGHATEMASALVDHALGQSNVERIVAHSSARDRPTLAVLLRCGFILATPEPENGLMRCERLRTPAPEEEDEGAEDEDAENADTLPDDDE
jgi:RimJ/RimL family protein N-acetyltransferase